MPIRTVLLSLLRLGLGFCRLPALTSPEKNCFSSNGVFFCTQNSNSHFPVSSTQRVCVTFGLLDTNGLSLKIGIQQVNHDSYHIFKCQSYESIIARAHMIMRTLVVLRKGSKFRQRL